MSTTVLEGVRLAYSVQGAGEPMLMIQGLGYGRGGWGPAPGMLARRFQVVTLDNRGFGDSDAPPGPYTTAQLAEDALAVLDAVEIETAHVVGISLGGMVAQELVLARPERVRRLVLCSTTPGGAESFPMPEQTVALMGRQPHLEPEEAMRLFVVHGTADNVVDVRNAHLLADAIPESRLVLLEGVGHLLPWERPQEFTALVEEFVS